ncbi:MAG TPA: hypothetical protein VNT99_20425 [Methylomirabilota bacterium]|nr:hypothetical protein [Methylomirabilota bacterium]
MHFPAWVQHGPWEPTPRFYDARLCPDCHRPDSAIPHRVAPPNTPGAIRARCHSCARAGGFHPTWREAVADFYGALAGCSPRFGPKVGDMIEVRDSDPVGCYPLRGLQPGDLVKMLDFETGAYTVQRERDGLETIIAYQNIGRIVTNQNLPASLAVG